MGLPQSATYLPVIRKVNQMTEQVSIFNGPSISKEANTSPLPLKMPRGRGRFPEVEPALEVTTSAVHWEHLSTHPHAGEKQVGTQARKYVGSWNLTCCMFSDSSIDPEQPEVTVD